MPEMTRTDRPENESEHDVTERLSRTLDEWRGRIDELLVQFDLAGLEMREKLGRHRDQVENAYLAARSRLSEVRRDATHNANSLCEGTEKLIGDLQHVYEAAEAALHRDPAR